MQERRAAAMASVPLGLVAALQLGITGRWAVGPLVSWEFFIPNRKGPRLFLGGGFLVAVWGGVALPLNSHFFLKCGFNFKGGKTNHQGFVVHGIWRWFLGWPRQSPGFWRRRWSRKRPGPFSPQHSSLGGGFKCLVSPGT